MKEYEGLGYSYDIELIIEDLFSSRRQKKIGPGEYESKTLVLLTKNLIELKDIKRQIFWLDVGCGNGRCLKSIDALESDGNLYEQKLINYIGIDESREHLRGARQLAQEYNINQYILLKNGRHLGFKIKFDLISAILLLHELDPFDLPYILNDLIKLLDENGKLIITDFNDPIEREPATIVWDVVDISNIVEKVGGVIADVKLINSSNDPESKFYCLHVENSKRKCNFKKFIKSEFMQFLDNKVRKLEYNMIYYEDRTRSAINKKLGMKKDYIPTEGDISKLKQKKLDDIFLLFRKRELIRDQLLYLEKMIRKYKSGPSKKR